MAIRGQWYLVGSLTQMSPEENHSCAHTFEASKTHQMAASKLIFYCSKNVINEGVIKQGSCMEMEGIVNKWTQRSSGLGADGKKSHSCFLFFFFP